MTSGVDKPLRGIAFGDENNIIISGREGTVFKSTDGGNTWTQKTSGTINWLTGLHFTTNLTGYACGAEGTIIKTTDGGESWNPLSSGTNQFLLYVYFPSEDIGYISGAEGGILKTTNGGVGILKNSGEIPERYNLEQNYPNPFNPTTKIRFDILKKEIVNLSVYDIRGREVTLLVSNELSPGSYEYTFEARSLSSGVYFYKLETGSVTLTKKMLLTK